MKSWLALAALVLAGSGCGKNLRPDPVIPVIDAGYPSLEVVHQGKIHHGGAMLSIHRGLPLETIDLSFRGYYEGLYRISSQRCGIDFSGSYAQSELVKIPLQGTAVQDCVISITMTPSYPKRRGIQTDSFRGHIAIKVTNGEDWHGEFIKVTGSWHHDLRIFVGGTGVARVIADACGVEYDQILPIVDGFVEFDVAKAAALPPGKSCILDGAIITDEYEDYLFNVFISNYKTTDGTKVFSPLNAPSVRLVEDKIEVVASRSVSVLALDDQYIIDFKGKFKFDPNRSHVLRAITVMGRLVIGVYEPSTGWEWLQ